MITKLRSLAAAGSMLGVLAMASPALAAPITVTASVGPVSVPGVPLSVCVDDGSPTCVPTPPATTVALTVSVTVNPDAVTLPTVTPGLCSNGQGVALVVTSGSAGGVISGSVTVTVGGTPTVIPIGLTSVPANQTVIVSACVSPGVGLPALPGLPGLPALPGLPGLPALPLPGLPI